MWPLLAHVFSCRHTPRPCVLRNVKNCISAHVRHEQAQEASSATLASLQKEESHLKFRLLHVHNQIEEAIRAGSDGRAIGSAFSLKHSAPTVAELEEGELTI
eukprot:scaffold881_cov123-Isochrysis_galbana.AAC.10